MNDADAPHLIDPPIGHLQNPGELTAENRIMLTLWGEEMYRSGLASCLAIYNDQPLAGKMILFFQYRKEISDKIYNLYKESIQQHFENEVRLVCFEMIFYYALLILYFHRTRLGIISVIGRMMT